MTSESGMEEYSPTPGRPVPTAEDERMLKWFEYKHLPKHLQGICLVFHSHAVHLINHLEPGPERTVALRKLLESKDAAVRAAFHPGC